MAKRIREYDKKGNLIHFRGVPNHIHLRDYECWKKYDKEDRIIYCINNCGKEQFYKYNKRGDQENITKKEYEKLYK